MLLLVTKRHGNTQKDGALASVAFFLSFFFFPLKVTQCVEKTDLQIDLTARLGSAPI